MKKIMILLCLFSYMAQAQQMKSILSNEVKDVKIFQAGAQVDRTLKATVEAGITQLNVEGLSANIDKNSISVSGNGDIVLLSVVQHLNFLNTEKKSAEQIRMEDTLEVLQNQQERLNGNEAIYKEEQSLLQANKAVGGANTGVTIDNLQKVADFFRNRMMELQEKMIEVHQSQKKLAEQLSKVQQQLTELNGKRNQPTSTIAITVSAKSHATASLDLSYYVTGAGWTPQYDLRAKNTDGPVQLAYKANVFQQTGESWDDVKLTLSTGNPSLGGMKPTLGIWYLDFYRPTYRGKYKENKSLQPISGNTAYDIEAAPSENNELSKMETVANYVTMDENQLSTEFEIAMPYTIHSDGQMHAVDIKNYSLKATYAYFAVPKIDKDAFLVAHVTGWEELNLLPGKANVYFESAYVGESFIDPRSTKDTLDLSLGRDKRIVISREKKKDLSTERFIGSTVEKELNYVLTIRNLKKESISITIEDQVPVTKNGDITVKAGEYSGANYNEETGQLTWKLTVAPSASVEKKFDYSIRFPKDKLISGL
jgi:uncharacterized protein (TIGR02231 family)